MVRNPKTIKYTHEWLLEQEIDVVINQSDIDPQEEGPLSLEIRNCSEFYITQYGKAPT